MGQAGLEVISWMKSKSVFKTTKAYSMNDAMSMMFHRLAATMYLAYVVWAVLAALAGTPSLERQEDFWELLFPAAVFLTALPSLIGAAFFPHAARMELFAGSAFAMTMLVYAWFSTQSALEGSGSWSSVLFIVSVILMPIFRSIIIIYFLIKQAETRNLESD